MLVYSNLDCDGPIEAMFTMPLSKKQVVSKLTCTIGDKHIEAKVKEKEEAKN